ncbi:MAG: hypothetical protein QOJ64_2239, partial [Acidobacteriota bacterium]|nr:hypothetical protein [Acidobacteriota bacterium]
MKWESGWRGASQLETKVFGRGTREQKNASARGSYKNLIIHDRSALSASGESSWMGTITPQLELFPDMEQGIMNNVPTSTRLAKRLIGEVLALTVWLVAFAAFGQAQQFADVRELPPNTTLEREMTGAETHRYKFAMKANEFFQVRVEQKGVDVALKLSDASGNGLATMDSPNSKDGSEALSFVAAKVGGYALEVSGFDPKAEKGSYTIRREASRTATGEDKRRVEVERLFIEGMTARDARGQREISISKLEEAMAGWQELGDEYLAQLTARQVQQIREAQNQRDVRPLSSGEVVERQLKRGEIHYYAVELEQRQVLRLDAQEKGIDLRITLVRIADKQIVAQTDFGFGYDRETLTFVAEQAGVYSVVVVSPESPLSGRYQLTAEVKDAATATDKERIAAGRLLAEGLASRNKGSAEGLREAIAKWEEAIPLWKKSDEKYWEGYTSTCLGGVYDALGEKQKALEFNNLALPLRRAVGDRSGEAVTLNNIGGVYNDLGEKQKALEFLNLALPLYKAVGDRSGEAVTLNNIGRVYDALGEKQKALEFYNLALPLFRAVGDRSGEAVTLNNIGAVYAALGEKQKALEFLNLALPLRRAVGDRSGEAVTLNNIGGVYDALGEKQKA